MGVGVLISGIYSIIMGAFIGYMPMYIFKSALKANIFGILPFVSIFFIVSLSLIIVGFLSVVSFIKTKYVERNGTSSIGHFVSMKSNFKKNTNGKNISIKYYYTDNTGNQKYVTTKHIYNNAEAKYFENKKEFNIKYKGNTAIILDSPLSNTTYTYESQIGSNLSTDNKIIYTCEYCGSIQQKPGKCKNCGAQIK
ncbi:MAG: hypothetical protein IJD48_01000 [Clostridia bacterium]|nr:hypothetical protein [Clostridia bacterium]